MYMGKAHWSASEGEAAGDIRGAAEGQLCLVAVETQVVQALEVGEKEAARYITESRLVLALRLIWVTGGHLKS